MVNFNEANLKEAWFGQTNFEKEEYWEVNLKKADFLDANMEGAFLHKADLSKCKNVKPSQLRKARTLFGTILTPELKEKAQKLCLEKFEKVRIDKLYEEWLAY